MGAASVAWIDVPCVWGDHAEWPRWGCGDSIHQIQLPQKRSRIKIGSSS